MEQTIVFYDGGCRMCVGVTGWLSKIDHRKEFRLEPYQHSELIKKYPQINPSDCEHELHLISRSGKVLRGADAVLDIWEQTGHWTAFLAGIFKHPPFIWLARPLYRFIARNRKNIYN